MRLFALGIGFALGICSLLGLASAKNQTAWDVKINSFVRVGDNDRLGEVCGRVTGPASELAKARVHVIADPDTNNPGSYVSMVDNTGAFCHLIHTYYGQVAVEVMAPVVVSTQVRATVK